MVQSKLFLIFLILFATATNTVKTKNNSKTIERNEVNFNFDVDNDIENEININYLNNLQKEAIKIKTKFENNNKNRVENFTDFIQALINKLIQLDDFKLQQFFTVIDDEARKYHYRGCKFHQLIFNHGFRKFLGRLLTGFKMQPINSTRNALEAVAYKLKHEIFDEKEKEIINMIKALYNEASLENFKNFLNNIEAYNKNSIKNLNIAAIVKEGMRSIIFDHYSQLNSNARMAFKTALNDYWSYFEEMSTFEPNVTPPKLRPLRKRTTKFNVNLRSNYIGTIKSQDVLVAKRNSFSYPIPILISNYDDVVNEMPNNNKQKYYDHSTERTKTTYPQSSVNLNDNVTFTSNYEYNLHFLKTSLPPEANLDAYEYLTSTRKKVKWLTFKTLYPEFEEKWLTMTKTNTNNKNSTTPVLKCNKLSTEALHDYRKSFQNIDVTSVDTLSAQQNEKGNNNVFHNRRHNNNSIIYEERISDDKKKDDSIDNDVVFDTNLIKSPENRVDSLNTQVRNDTEIIDFKSQDSSSKLHTNNSAIVTDKIMTDLLDRDVNIKYDTKSNIIKSSNDEISNQFLENSIDKHHGEIN